MSRIQLGFFFSVFVLTGVMQWFLLKEAPRVQVISTPEAKGALIQAVAHSLEQKGVMQSISRVDRSIAAEGSGPPDSPSLEPGKLSELFERSKDPYLSETMIARIQSHPREVLQTLADMGHDPDRRAAAIDGLLLFVRFSPDPESAKEELRFQISRLNFAADQGGAELEISIRNAKEVLESSESSVET